MTAVETANPPITAMARGRCSSAPEPRPRASGIRPASVQSVVVAVAIFLIGAALFYASRPKKIVIL